MENYLLQPVKSVILAIPNQSKKKPNAGEINILMNEESMPLVDEAAHMGIVRSTDSQESTVNQNIEKARRTVYSLMGAGLHGENGLDPATSIHILQIYCYEIKCITAVLLNFTPQVIVGKSGTRSVSSKLMNW